MSLLFLVTRTIQCIFSKVYDFFYFFFKLHPTVSLIGAENRDDTCSLNLVSIRITMYLLPFLFDF